MIRGGGTVGRVGGAGMSGGAGRLWTPADLGSRLTAWFDAGAGVTLVDGLVSAWAASAGTANLVAAQATAANRPPPSAVDGFPTVSLGEAGKYLDVTPAQLPPVNQSFAIFAAFVQPVAGDTAVLMQWGPLDGTAPKISFGASLGGFYGYEHDFVAAALPSGPPCVTTWQYVIEPPNGGNAGGCSIGSLNGKKRGVSRTVASSVTTTYNNTNGIIGCKTKRTGITDVATRLAGLAICSTAEFSGNEAAMWEGYYAHKMGSTAQLPDGHPYKSEPPRI